MLSGTLASDSPRLRAVTMTVSSVPVSSTVLAVCARAPSVDPRAASSSGTPMLKDLPSERRRSEWFRVSTFAEPSCLMGKLFFIKLGPSTIYGHAPSGCTPCAVDLAIAQFVTEGKRPSRRAASGNSNVSRVIDVADHPWATDMADGTGSQKIVPSGHCITLGVARGSLRSLTSKRCVSDKWIRRCANYFLAATVACHRAAYYQRRWKRRST